MKKIATLLIAVITAFSAAIPGQAAPVFVLSNPDTRYTVQNVQWNGDRRWRPDRHNWHGPYGHHHQAIIALGAITTALGITTDVTTVPMPQRFSEVLQLAP
ncbi:MAG: hypothetical protein QHC90_30340 [Shinella sp.]|nr:hypothetical protein [Shinella sp.]